MIVIPQLYYNFIRFWPSSSYLYHIPTITDSLPCLAMKNLEKLEPMGPMAFERHEAGSGAKWMVYSGKSQSKMGWFRGIPILGNPHVEV